MPLATKLDDTGVRNGFVLYEIAGVDGSLGKLYAKLEEAFIGVSIPIKLTSYNQLLPNTINIKSKFTCMAFKFIEQNIRLQ